MDRPLTDRERDVLDALLAVEFDGVADLRRQAKDARVVGGCGCGCPSINFYSEPGTGLQVRVNAAVRGSDEELFLFTLGTRLAGIEYTSISDQSPVELPEPGQLDIHPE